LTETKNYRQQPFCNIQKKAHRTNSTFGFCPNTKPALKKPKELFFAKALKEIEWINDIRTIY